MLEKNFQHKLIHEIQDMFPGCIIMKNDASYIQGIPDLLVLYKDKWAALECKVTSKSHRQPNQNYYVNRMNKMSYSSFVSPDNKEEVLDELQQAFRA